MPVPACARRQGASPPPPPSAPAPRRHPHFRRQDEVEVVAHHGEGIQRDGKQRRQAKRPLRRPGLAMGAVLSGAPVSRQQPFAPNRATPLDGDVRNRPTARETKCLCVGKSFSGLRPSSRSISATSAKRARATAPSALPAAGRGGSGCPSRRRHPARRQTATTGQAPAPTPRACDGSGPVRCAGLASAAIRTEPRHAPGRRCAKSPHRT